MKRLSSSMENSLLIVNSSEIFEEPLNQRMGQITPI